VSYRIRSFRPDDAEVLTQIILIAIRTIGSKAYAPEQVQAWAAFHVEPDLLRARALDGATILVAVDAEDRPVAHALLEHDGHLDQLYCHPDHSRRGLARSRFGSRPPVHRSEPARPARVRAGRLHRLPAAGFHHRIPGPARADPQLRDGEVAQMNSTFSTR
jgi:GNAT superfamily N-acetyltransferase